MRFLPLGTNLITDFGSPLCPPTPQDQKTALLNAIDRIGVQFYTTEEEYQERKRYTEVVKTLLDGGANPELWDRVRLAPFTRARL